MYVSQSRRLLKPAKLITKVLPNRRHVIEHNHPGLIGYKLQVIYFSRRRMQWGAIRVNKLAEYSGECGFRASIFTLQPKYRIRPTGNEGQKQAGKAVNGKSLSLTFIYRRMSSMFPPCTGSGSASIHSHASEQSLAVRYPDAPSILSDVNHSPIASTKVDVDALHIASNAQVDFDLAAFKL